MIYGNDTERFAMTLRKPKKRSRSSRNAFVRWRPSLRRKKNLEIVRMVKAVKMDNKELTAFLKAYASGMISLPEGMLQEGNTENEETEGYEDEA